MKIRIADNGWWKDEQFVYLPQFYCGRGGRTNNILILGLIWGKGKWTLWVERELK